MQGNPGLGFWKLAAKEAFIHMVLDFSQNEQDLEPPEGLELVRDKIPCQNRNSVFQVSILSKIISGYR